MNIEKIKNFSKDEQKELEYFEMLRNVIVERDSEELDEGIDLVVGRKFATKIDLLLNLVITLEEDKEELKKQEATQRKINELLVQRYSNSISVQKVKDKIEELDEMINQISKGNLQKYTVGEIICFKKILKELLEGDD